MEGRVAAPVMKAMETELTFFGGKVIKLKLKT